MAGIVTGVAAVSAGATTITVLPSTNLSSPEQTVPVTIAETPNYEFDVVQSARGPGYSRCNYRGSLYGNPRGQTVEMDLRVTDRLVPELRNYGQSWGPWGLGCAAGDQSVVPCAVAPA